MFGTGFAATVTAELPDFVESCTEVAVIVAVPVVTEVKMPALLMVPIVEGLTEYVTADVYAPVPDTVEVHVEVAVVKIEEGVQDKLTDVIVGAGAFTVTVPDPETFV